MSINYGFRRDRAPRFRPLHEEDEAARQAHGWDPRKTYAENMGHESLFDRPEDDFGWPQPAPQRRKPTRQARALAAAGRGEDTEIAHVARGEYVIPRAFQTPELMAALRRAAAAYGVPVERFNVGNVRNRTNPNTGAPEFWFEGLTPEMENFARRAANTFIPIDPLSGSARYPLTGNLKSPINDATRPNFDPRTLAPPPQYMTSAPMRALEEKIVDDPRMMPSFRSQAIASLPTNRETQKQVLGEAAFPGAKYQDIEDRMFENNGRIGYTDWDGIKYYAEPSLKFPTSREGLDETIKWAGSKIGPSMTDAAAFAGGRFGPRGSVAAASGADIVRQYAANKLANEQKPWSNRALQTGGVAADELFSVDSYLDWLERRQ